MMGLHETKQKTLDGVYIPPLPQVRTTDGHIVDYDRNRIVRQIVEETRLVETFYGYVGASEEQAHEIAREVEQRIRMMGLKYLSGPLIREVVNMALLWPFLKKDWCSTVMYARVLVPRSLMPT